MAEQNGKFSRSQETRIKSFLKALPHLDLSQKGIENVAKKFGTTTAVITDFIKAENGKSNG